jgi:acetyl-CoA acyltransferase 1
MQRLQRVVGHLQHNSNQSILPSPSDGKSKGKSPDDIVIVSAVRTAIGKAKRGGFKDTHPTDMLSAVLSAAVDRAGLKRDQVCDIVVGNVSGQGGFATQSRMAMFLAGFPESVPITTCNRQCSSGLQAVAHVAANIKSGNYEIGIGAGLESMSQHPMGAEALGDINEKVFNNELGSACLNTMGQTSENVAEKYGVSRQKQDQMAYESHMKAIRAQKEGRFKNEIVPVEVKVKDKDGKEQSVVIDKDEGPRADTTLEGLSKLKPAFKKGGSTTAGNSSQVSDGAAAVVLTTRRKAQELKLPILGTFRSFAVAGVRPEIMGIGPAEAIPKALKLAGLGIGDIDIYELNEAFASQAVYCVEKLGIDMKKVNPNGGAIALGHPLGMTGARQIATLLNELKRTGGRYGVVSMCIGTGMGAAAVFELEK